MSYTKESLNKLYRTLAQEIDISDEMFNLAEKEYNDLGTWIDEKTPTYKISIYPQGSFALGTVVRPISGKDDYDLDLVCSFEQSYGLSAKELKCDIVKPLLVGYKSSTSGIIEKRRCWHVDYDDIPNFHMDVVPAYKAWDRIKITEHDEQVDDYRYIGSNPAGYAEWFLGRCAYQHKRLLNAYISEHNRAVAQADIEVLKRQKVKTPLQRAVQILKRHRDISCSEVAAKDRPISIIITTIAGQLYEEQDDIVGALDAILSGAEKYIYDHMRDGNYYIMNPSYEGENFANKWNEPKTKHRADVFIHWLRQARDELVSDKVYEMDRIGMGSHIAKAFGVSTQVKVFKQMAEAEKEGILSGTIKVDSARGTLSTSGTIQVPPNHHYGL